MNQSIIWSFITEYKRVVGTDLHYLQLIQSESATRQALKEAHRLNDRQLNSVAHSLQALLDSGTFRFMPPKDRTVSKKRRPLKSKTQASVQIDYQTTQQPSRLGNITERQYEELLRQILGSSDMAVLQREELDTFCRRKSLDRKTAISLENRVRDELELYALDWEEEAHNSVRRFIRLHGELTETDRLILVNTYAKRQRINKATLESIIEDEVSSLEVNRPGGQISLFIKGVWGMAAVVGVLVIAVAGLYFKNDSNITDATAVIEGLPTELLISGSITEDTIWHAETTYRLQGPVFVEGEARLTIEPGTQITGEFGSALIVTRNAQLYARGQQNAPIVFTSAKAAGERQRGDWGGVVLLGNASINRPQGQIEGVDAEDVRGQFGGQDDADSCGVLEYVRIEFAGFEVFANNELNGLTMGGCGQNTIVRHVQVHQAADDGVEMFGGTADLKHIVISGAKDDSLDWDMGWRGRVQFMVVQQHGDAGDNGFEADNWSKNHDAEPRSYPVMYNVTLVGSDNPDSGQRAMNLRRGTAGEFHNFIVMGHSRELVDIRDDATALLARQGDLRFSHSLIYNIGVNGNDYFPNELGNKDDDGGFDEATLFGSQYHVRFGVDPLLPLAQQVEAPVFIPAADSPAARLSSSLPQAEFWDENANYTGALRPGIQTEDSWLYGWTAFPKK